MDFVCFTESVGVCEEENMTHKVVNPLFCSLVVTRTLIPYISYYFIYFEKHCYGIARSC
jgi:hypothetical protein